MHLIYIDIFKFMVGGTHIWPNMEGDGGFGGHDPWG